VEQGHTAAPWQVAVSRQLRSSEAALLQRPWFRIAGPLGMVLIVVEATQMRGVLVGLLTLVAYAPMAVCFATARPFRSAWVNRRRITQLPHAVALSFASICLVFPWSTRTCALVTGVCLVAVLADLFRQRRHR
jgi:hypothetical protein